MGCPAKKVCNKWAGSALMQDEALALQIIEAVVAACAAHSVPVTLKMRTGWCQSQQNALSIALAAQAAGVAMVTIHGRTREQGYSGSAEHDTVRAVKSALSIPVVANGDIDSAERAAEVLRETGAELAGRTVRRLADMRYIGQGSEVTITLPEPCTAASTQSAFEAAYRALFARTPPGAAAQFVALRLSVTAPMPGAGNRLSLPRPARAAALKGKRPVFFPDGGLLETPVYDRYALPTGSEVAGPAVFEEDESTFVIGPGALARVLEDGSILAEMRA
jgi:N-methylhydantoinase A/oxoprolinase/acetone carboxylase beta subunit